VATEANNAAPQKRRRRHDLIGVVTSGKMQKTVVVRVTRQMRHSLYDRYVRVSKKFYAHDEQGEARPGDTVRIVETRPMSKLKRWRLAEILARRTSVH
jgi:small subunit ribosomal protein S17